MLALNSDMLSGAAASAPYRRRRGSEWGGIVRGGLFALGLLAAGALSQPGLAQVVITEYDVGAGYLINITAGPDGNLWCGDAQQNDLIRVTPAGAVARYGLVFPPECFMSIEACGPRGITTGPDRALWFTRIVNIGRWSMAGVETIFPGTGISITAGPDGNLWGTRRGAVWRMTTSGDVTSFPVPGGQAALPYGITSGPDSNVWFTDRERSRIGRLTPAGVMTELPLSSGYAAPSGITAGPDGAVWFAEESGKIGRITTTGSITEFAVPTVESGPAFICAGGDGNLWFTETFGNKVGRITPLGEITEFSIPTAQAYPVGITAGPDGNIWFLEAQAHKVARLALATGPATENIPTLGWHGLAGLSVLLVSAGLWVLKHRR